MPYRPRVLFLSPLFALFCTITIYSQTETTENFVIKPGQAVYILAVKGECGGGMQSGMMFLNGRPIIMPRHPLSGANQGQGQRQTLEHYEPLPLVAKMIGQAVQQDKTLVVVEAPEKADFIFRVCAAYHR